MRPTILLKLLIIISLASTHYSGLSQPGKPFCGTSDSLAEAYLQKLAKQVDLTKVRENAGEMLEYRLAVDVNHKTFLLHGGDKARIRKIVYEIFSEASAIFERETNIRLTVSIIHIWDQPEPYVLENDYDYFSNVLDYWNRNRHEERDAVVSLSNRSGTFYGGYRMCSSNFPAPGLTIPVDILAHELGHTLGSPHTHSCYWPGGPIDRCFTLESTSGTCPPGFAESVNGTIMSYCRSKLTFHPLCRNLIRSYAEGAVEPSFSLKAFDQKPGAPGLLLIDGALSQSTGPTPSFEWYPSARTKQYRIQIARDEGFSQMVDDTVVNQSFFQTPGLHEGRHFARYRPENDLGSATWSVSAGFTVAPISETSPPPLLTQVNRDNSGVLSGAFRLLQGISHYQLSLAELFFDREYEADQQSGQTGNQNFIINLGDKRDHEFSLRYRVKMNGKWSRWSDPVWQNRPLSTIPLSIDSLQPLSASPILAIKQWVPFLTRDPTSASMEIATDSEFRNVVFRQPFSNNAMGNWHTDKMVAHPSLDEHTTYFSRSRVQLIENRKSAWSVYRFTTGVRDNRFRYLGTPFTGMSSTNFSMNYDLHNRFVNTGDVLYVANFQCGYHKTTDLKSWESYIPSTTNGQSPMLVMMFGASPQGETLTVDEQQSFVLKTGNEFTPLGRPINVNWTGMSSILHTQKAGFFIKSNGRGVTQYHNGTWTAHQVPMGYTICMAKDNEERVWAIGQDGYTWRYEDGQWTGQPRFPVWESISGMAFDKNDNCLVYGDFGVYKLNKPAGNWEQIEPLRSHAVKKIVFDDENNMWLSSYRWSDNWSKPALEKYALVKFAGTQASVYSDGLNFLREPFDIEYFKGQLLIMTTGGEIHKFDEKQILAFAPKPAYCTGASVTLTLSTNSTFNANNKTFVELRLAASDKIIAWEVPQSNNHSIPVQLPDTLSKGRYTFAIHTTNPEIRSNESDAFDILPPPVAEVPAIERNSSHTILKIKDSEGNQYQWLLNGVAIAGATGATLIANQEGNYAVAVRNQGGCSATSESVHVEIEQPKELVLLQNKPNPLGASADISFYLPGPDQVQLDLFNARGQKVAELKNSTLPQGWHSVNIDGNTIPTGVYIYRLKAGAVTRSVKMVRQ